MVMAVAKTAAVMMDTARPAVEGATMAAQTHITMAAVPIPMGAKKSSGLSLIVLLAIF
jgi:hypothetical protein